MSCSGGVREESEAGESTTASMEFGDRSGSIFGRGLMEKDCDEVKTRLKGGGGGKKIEGAVVAIRVMKCSELVKQLTQ